MLNIVKYTVFYLNIFSNVIYFSSLQCHMILQKSFSAQETFLIIIHVGHSCAA